MEQYLLIYKIIDLLFINIFAVLYINYQPVIEIHLTMIFDNEIIKIKIIN
jgi:hypothetical protein